MKGIFITIVILCFSTIGISQNYQNYNLFSQNSTLNNGRTEPGFILKIRANVHANLYNDQKQYVKFKVFTSQSEFYVVELEKQEIFYNGSINVTTASGDYFQYSGALLKKLDTTICF